MARRLCTMLPLILVISFLLFGVSSCSRPLSLEEPRPRAPTAPPAAHHSYELPYHPDAAETGTRLVTVAITENDGQSGRRTRADGDAGAPAASMAMASKLDKEHGGGVVGSSGHRMSALLRLPAPVLRRFLLAGAVDGADSAARASCRSNDVHISCTPPPEH